MLPAIDVTRSVSRIGGKAQHPAIKQEAGRIRLDYLQFLELEAFTRFGTRLEPAMEAKLKRGRVLRQIMVQDRLTPVSATGQLTWLIAYNEKLLDDCELNRLPSILLQLEAAAKQSKLTLDASRDQWRQQIQTWLQPT